MNARAWQEGQVCTRCQCVALATKDMACGSADAGYARRVEASPEEEQADVRNTGHANHQ